MSSKSRIDKLASHKLSEATTVIVVTEDSKVIKKKVIGNNKDKVIKIVVRL